MLAVSKYSKPEAAFCFGLKLNILFGYLELPIGILPFDGEFEAYVTFSELNKVGILNFRLYLYLKLLIIIKGIK